MVGPTISNPWLVRPAGESNPKLRHVTRWKTKLSPELRHGQLRSRSLCCCDQGLAHAGRRRMRPGGHKGSQGATGATRVTGGHRGPTENHGLFGWFGYVWMMDFDVNMFNCFLDGTLLCFHGLCFLASVLLDRPVSLHEKKYCQTLQEEQFAASEDRRA